jgi:hypothetical protein
LTLEASADTVINTLGLSPRGLLVYHNLVDSIRSSSRSFH